MAGLDEDTSRDCSGMTQDNTSVSPRPAKTADNIKDPLFRFFEREITSGSKLLTTVRTDLSNVVEVCEMKRKQTNYLRNLISDLAKGEGRRE